MGLTYLGEDACEESPGRGVLLHRRYCATLNDRDGFWRKLHAAATVQGVLQRETLLFSDSSPSPAGNKIEELQSPRIWRFGARINF